MTDARRALPSVTALLDSAALQPLLDASPRGAVVDAIRGALDDMRRGAMAMPSEPGAWAELVSGAMATRAQRSLRTVVNATGVVLHTNLGRAPLADAALAAVTDVARGYSTLEYDLDAGARGSRYRHCAALLRELTGAEDALVVNNCAGALVLALNALSFRREAILSRGELVEIGGSFRVHDLVERSGARLREVGATNRTHLADYERAISQDSGVLLKVHRSNFSQSGFVADVAVATLVPLARAHDLPILHDLGSGLLIPLDQIGLSGEPTARIALEAGASVVMMSGDKLLGGPQCGILLGSAPLIDAMRANPLARSYRVDKMTLAALEATLALYRDPAQALRDIPVLAMLGETVPALAARAERCVVALRAEGVVVSVTNSTATVGAGAFPDSVLPSIALALPGAPDTWAARLRAASTPVIGRTTDGRHLLDLRTVPDASCAALVDSVRSAHA